jgi:hypothetical protein
MKRLFALVVAAVVCVTTSTPAHGALIFVSSRSALGGNDYVDWGTLGPNGTPVSNPFNITSNLGDTLTVSMVATGNFERRDQSLGWNGNFAPGDALLWTNTSNNSNNPISVFNFDVGVAAVGTQIQANFFGGFVARIEAFDAGNNSLGFFTVNGLSTWAGDNSAIFLGVRSTTTPIARIAFSLDSASSNLADFAINRLDFDSNLTVIPEPATLAVFGLMAAGVFGVRRRMKATA